MASELFIGLHGSEDPTKATFPFLMAGGALDGGNETAIVLMGLINNLYMIRIQPGPI